MASLGRFDVIGPAEPGRYRAALLIDFVTALLLAMVAFPFPIVRASFAIPVFVASVLASIVVAHVVYIAVVLLLWGRTPGMYLLDLGLVGGKVSLGRGLTWGLGAALEFWPRAVGMPMSGPTGGLASRLSGLELGSTGNDGGHRT